MDPITFLGGARDLMEQAVELQAAEELAIACRRLRADLDVEARRAKEHGLGERRVVRLEKSRRARRAGGSHDLLLAKIGEERRGDLIRRKPDLPRDGVDQSRSDA